MKRSLLCVLVAEPAFALGFVDFDEFRTWNRILTLDEVSMPFRGERSR